MVFDSCLRGTMVYRIPFSMRVNISSSSKKKFNPLKLIVSVRLGHFSSNVFLLLSKWKIKNYLLKLYKHNILLNDTLLRYQISKVLIQWLLLDYQFLAVVILCVYVDYIIEHSLYSIHWPFEFFLMKVEVCFHRSFSICLVLINWNWMCILLLDIYPFCFEENCSLFK